ncbi:MAG: Bug family tripartite tricarboxylate transporter substrate binding protein [Alphaproteobacteria bacterium]
MKIAKAILGVAVAAVVAAPAAADDFYKGKTVTAYVGYNSGGTNDIVTRLVAAHIGKHMGGNPSVIVRNMPGAGSRTLAGYLYNKAAKDGSEFGNIDRAVTTETLLDPSVRNPFEILEFTWVGTPSQEALLCVAWHTSPFKSLKDMTSREMIIASPGSTSGEAITAQVLNAVIGTRIRSVTGYPGGAEMNLAMQRGEVDGRCGIGWGAIKATSMQWIRDKELTILLQTATERHPDIKDVPSSYELVKSEEDRKALEVIYANQKLGRPFIAPPGMPEDRKAALRRAFDATMTDPAFVSDAARQNVELQPLTGEQMEKVLRDAYGSAPAVLARVAELVKPAQEAKQK